jgi:hypothetical protein
MSSFPARTAKVICLKLRFLRSDTFGSGDSMDTLTLGQDDEWEDEPMITVLIRLGAVYVRETKKRVEWELILLDTHKFHFPWDWALTVTKKPNQENVHER